MQTSIVVPVYNDPGGLRTTVDSLLDQTADDYEIVVADNGSTDATSDVAREYARRDRIHHVVEDGIQSSYAARNAGIEVADGDVLGFVDADMWVEEDYVASIAETVTDGGSRYVGCDVELVADDGTIARYRRATGFPVERYLAEHRFAPTCCLVTTREVFDAVGTFDSRLRSNGDLEFGRRVHEAGFDLAFEPDVTLYHPARSSVRELLAQSSRIGRGRGEVRAYHGDRLETRHPLAPRSFLPVHPFGFVERVSSADPARSELLLWYLVACLQKWSMTAGFVRETASSS